MRPSTIVCCGLLVAGFLPELRAADEVLISSPGLTPSKVNAAGQLVEDWGAVGISVRGKGVVEGPVALETMRLDGAIPAAQVSADRGAVRLRWTVYRAPIHPAGVDVLEVIVEAAREQAADLVVGLTLPDGLVAGRQTLRRGGRTVVTLPAGMDRDEELRDWGWCDEATSIRGWAKPVGPCDPAFQNIRAGMGGVPIVYRFSLAKRGSASVILGFCESHWAEPAQRPLVCRVEGAAPRTVDPVAVWGQHQPGVLAFSARDENGDGRLEIVVRSAAQAADRNPILNAIWIFPAGESPDLDRVRSGELSAAAIRYVDAGGESDQSLYAPAVPEFPLQLPAGGTASLTFLVACPGGSAPLPGVDTWTARTLYVAARDVWRGWPSP